MGVQRGTTLIDVNDIVGKRVGKLEVIEYDTTWYDNTGGGERRRHKYICRCDCGKIKSVQRDPLLAEIVHSCGCGRKRKKNE